MPIINQSEIEELFRMLEPKIKKSLLQTSQQNRQDLEQDIKVIILTKIRQNVFKDVPGFFEFIGQEAISSENMS